MPEFKQLIEGYHRFRDDAYPSQKVRYDALSSSGQSPSVMIISCCDSRVDPATVFDTEPGQAFVVRNVANLVPPFEQSSGLHGVSAAIEFAILGLKVKHIVVMGHGMCGGCRAALTQEMHGNQPGEGGFIADWISLLDDARQPIAEALGTQGREAERAMEHAAVKVSLSNLRSFPCVRRNERDGSLKLHGSYFSISDGQLHILDEATGSFAPAERT